MTLAKSRKGVLNDYRAAPAQVQKFFAHLPKLLDDLSLDVSLSKSVMKATSGNPMT